MAISRDTGATASLSSAATTLAFTAGTLTNGESIVISVSIASSATVTGISDGSANTYSFKSGITNGSAVRSETWTCPITAATASRTITITFSGSTLASAAYELYIGVSSFGNAGTPKTGTSFFVGVGILTQDYGNWVVGSLASATHSGDTFTVQDGTITQYVIPALTTASTALVDNGNGQQPVGTMDCSLQVSTSRAWASTGVELRSGNPSASIIASPQISSASYGITYITSPPLKSSVLGVQMIPLTIPDGILGTPYSQTITTSGAAELTVSLWVASGALPTGLSLNSSTGVISGTPTVLGKYAFAVWCVDRYGLGELYNFTISITTPASGGSYSYVS